MVFNYDESTYDDQSGGGFFGVINGFMCMPTKIYIIFGVIMMILMCIYSVLKGRGFPSFGTICRGLLMICSVSILSCSI